MGQPCYIGLLLFLSICHKKLKAPFWIVGIVALTTPMIIIHSSVAYVDLFSNSLLAISSCTLAYIYFFKQHNDFQALCICLLGLIGASWSKYQLVPVVGFFFILCFFQYFLAIQPQKRMKFFSIISIAMLIAAVPYLKNIVLYHNPFWPVKIPFIGEDSNMKNALNNTLTAVKSGFSWADGTILGMGRGAGNAKIEDLIRKLKKEKPNKIYNLIESDFVKLKKKYKWGSNKYYNLAGKYRIHPTYIQTILNDKRYKKFDYIKIINNLKKINASKYNPNELMYSLFDKVSKKKIQTLKKINNINQKKALILGSNPINLKNKKFLENKIKNENYFVLALNTTKHLSESFINYRVSSHPLRLISEIENFKKTKSKIILPTGILPSNILKQVNMKSIYFYDMIIKPNLLTINKNYCILPNAMSIAFAIAVLIRWRFKYIELAGFDLRNNSADNTKGILKRINIIKKKIILKNPKDLNII